MTSQQITETVDHPEYYGGKDNVYEAIKVIEAWNLPFTLGNTVKYIARCGKKSKETHLKDLEKAKWYLDREIEKVKSFGRTVEINTNNTESPTTCVTTEIKQPYPGGVWS